MAAGCPGDDQMLNRAQVKQSPKINIEAAMPVCRYNFSYLAKRIISRKNFFFLLLGLVLTAGLVMPRPAPALAEDTPVRAGVFVSPPFVMMQAEGVFSGLAIDLWRQIADNLKLRTTYIHYNNFDTLLHDAREGQVDIILTNVAVTYERSGYLIFSYPWYDSGLRLMVMQSGSGSLLEELHENGLLLIYFLLFLLMLALTILLTLARRKWDRNFFPRWHEGMSFSFYELVVTAKSGRIQRESFGWKGYILASAWIVVGVLGITYVTSTLTTAMTTVSLTQDINSIYDLPGKDIGVIAGGAGDEYMRRHGFEVHVFDNMDAVAQALINNDIQAVVDDAPVLEYWAHNHPSQGVRVVGNILHPEKYAFASGLAGHALMDRVSLEIIRLHDLDLIQQLRANYFGRMNL